jgi:hypothetical protein
MATEAFLLLIIHPGKMSEKWSSVYIYYDSIIYIYKFILFYTFHTFHILFFWFFVHPTQIVVDIDKRQNESWGNAAKVIFERSSYFLI